MIKQMENPKPLVSIVIPVYNGSNYLGEAIDSALNQTYENIEIIVINDGSSDNGKTEEIALSYGNKIRYFYKENGGVSSALNMGISKMRGEYFSWLSHDDMYAPEKIERQVAQLQECGETDTVIALCGSRHINASTEFIGKLENKRFNNNELVSWENALMSVLSKGAFNGCALLIPKMVFDDCGGFNEMLRYSQDSEMWMRVFSSGYPLVYSENTDVYNRIHEKQLTQTGRALYLSDSITVCEKILPVLTEKSDGCYNFAYAYACRCAFHGNKYLVKKCNQYAKQHRPFSMAEKLKLYLRLAYGLLRPAIRKIYYRLFRGIKVK